MEFHSGIRIHFSTGWIALALTGGIALTGQLTGFIQPLKWNNVDSAMIALLLNMAVRTAAMEYIPQTAWVRISYLTGLYCIGRILWQSLNNMALLLLVGLLLIAGIGEVAYGLGQLYGVWSSHHNQFPLTGSFFNPGPYSGWLACIVPVAIYGILYDNGERSSGSLFIRYLSLTLLILITLVLIPAASRAAILAALCGSVVVAWSRIRSLSLWQHNWYKGVTLILLVIGMVGLYLMKKDSADGRLLIYKVTTNMIAEAPVFGWGWDGFSTMYNNFQALYFENGNGSEREMYLADNVTYGFNEVLEFTAEMGILGLLLVAGIAALLMRKWWHRNKVDSIDSIHFLGLGVLASWSTFALFSYPMSIPALVIILPISLSGLNTVLSKDQSNKLVDNESKRQVTHFAGKMITGILILGIPAYGLYWIYHFRPVAQE